MRTRQPTTERQTEASRLQCGVCGRDVPNTEKPVRLSFESPAHLPRNSDSCLMGMPGVGSVNTHGPVRKIETVIDRACFRTHSKLLRLLKRAGLVEIQKHVKSRGG